LVDERLDVPCAASGEQDDLLSGASAIDPSFNNGHFACAAFIYQRNVTELD
jgi:hypothetical protein